MYPPENTYFCFIDYTKAFDCVIHSKLWKVLKEMGIPDHFTCFLRNLYAGQEATVRTRNRKTDLFQIGEGVRQSCALTPCLLTYMTSSLCKMPGWMKYKLESRLSGEVSRTWDIKLNIQKTKIMADCWVLSQLFHSSLSPSSRGFFSSLFLP